MPQKKLEIELLPSFVKLKTTPDMRTLAMKLAQLKKATGGVEKIEGVLRNPNLTDEQFIEQMANLDFLSDYSVKTADEAIVLMKAVKKRVERYIKVL